MKVSAIKKKSLAGLVLCTIMTGGSFAQSKNEYARNPITPGYGTSNYFELMLKKTAVLQSAEGVLHSHAAAILSANVIQKGSKIILRIENLRPTKIAISINTVSGRRIYATNGTSCHTGNNVLHLGRPLPSGVYFISASGTGIRVKTVKAVITR